ncbi:MAG: hypothetical protein M1531_09185 [Chloroflexi bacterium]|nr:hypothetical protein [Chloroflexota bacterium]
MAYKPHGSHTCDRCHRTRRNWMQVNHGFQDYKHLCNSCVEELDIQAHEAKGIPYRNPAQYATWLMLQDQEYKKSQAEEQKARARDQRTERARRQAQRRAKARREARAPIDLVRSVFDRNPTGNLVDRQTGEVLTVAAPLIHLYAGQQLTTRPDTAHAEPDRGEERHEAPRVDGGKDTGRYNVNGFYHDLT